MLPRKLSFQLTPLLDLLLIVIFAQYLEVQQTSARTESNLQARTDALREEYESRLLDARRIRQRMEDRVEQLTDRVEQTLAREQQVGELVAELFQLPDEVIEQALRRRQQSPQPLSETEIERLRETFSEMAGRDGQDIVRHVLTLSEIRKRCDVWEVYVQPSGTTLLSTDADLFEFRALTSREFSDQVYQRFRSLPEPKRLVLVILSYGDAPFAARKAAIDGLVAATSRMQASTGGRSRFEYVVLGYTPGGPSLPTEPTEPADASNPSAP